MQRVSPDRGRRWRLVAAILAIGLLAKVGWILIVDHVDPALARNPDTPGYVDSGRALADEARFTIAPDSDIPQFIRTPGYPAYLSLFFRGVGEDQRWPLVGQAVMATVTALFVYLLATRLFGPTVGLVAVALAVLEPLQIVFSGMVLTESIFTTAFVVSVYVAARLVSDPDRWLLWGLGLSVSLAAATYIRPTTYYLPVALLLVTVAHGAVGGTAPKRALATGAALMIPYVVLVGAWQLRNAREVGTARFSGIEVVNMYWYRAAGTLAEADDVTIARARDDLTRELYADVGLPNDELTQANRLGVLPVGAALDQGRIYGRAYSEAVAILAEEPVAFVVVTTRGLVREVLAPGHTEVLSYFLVSDPHPIVVGAVSLSIVLTWLLAGFGVYLAVAVVPGRRWSHVVTGTMVLYVLVASAGPESEARMRAPVMPVVLIYVALAVTWLYAAFVDRRESACIDGSPGLK